MSAERSDSDAALARRKANAATFAVVGLAALLPGIFLPMLRIVRLHEEASYSILESVAVLARDGDYLIAVIILVFSVLFPLAKLALLLATALLRWDLGRGGIVRAARLSGPLGRYSMLDVFVIAVLLVVLKLEGIAEAELAMGTYLFGIGIACSFLAQACLEPLPRTLAVDEHRTVSTARPAQGTALAGRLTAATRGAGVRRLGAASAALLVLGAALLAFAPGGMVEAILIEKRPGIDVKFLSLPDTPDYALQVLFRDGDAHVTSTQDDTPIGNGILFAMPELELDAIREVRLWEDNSFVVSKIDLSVIPDEVIDRVRVERNRRLEGEKIVFTLSGRRSPLYWAGWSCLALGLALCASLGIGIVRRVAAGEPAAR